MKLANTPKPSTLAFLKEEGIYKASLLSANKVREIDKTYEGKTKRIKQIELKFACEKGVIARWFTLSWHEKSALRQEIERWAGQSLPDAETDDFVGKTALIVVARSVAESGKSYCNLERIFPWPPAFAIAEAEAAFEEDGQGATIKAPDEDPDWDIAPGGPATIDPEEE